MKIGQPIGKKKMDDDYQEEDSDLSCSEDLGMQDLDIEDEEEEVVEEELSGRMGEEVPLMDDLFLSSLKEVSTGTMSQAEDHMDFILIDIQVQQDKIHGTCVVLFGRCADGKSIHITLEGWKPYLYVQAPSGWIDSPANQDCIRLAMKDAVAFVLEDNKPLQKLLFTETFQNPIVSMELVVGTNIMGFDPSQVNQLFLKQKVISPQFMKPIRQCWEGGYTVQDTFVKTAKTIIVNNGGIPQLVDTSRKTETFNSNLDPVLQFMVDKGLSGLCYVNKLYVCTSSLKSMHVF